MAKIGYTQSTATVTNSASEIVSESPFSRWVKIQNNDAAGILYLNLSGTATASGTMVKVPPAGSLTLEHCTNSISAIGSIASNANVSILTRAQV